MDYVLIKITDLGLLSMISLPVVAASLLLAALLLFPIVWLVALLLRVIGISVAAAIEFTGALVRLPARLLRGQPTRRLLGEEKGVHRLFA